MAVHEPSCFKSIKMSTNGQNLNIVYKKIGTGTQVILVIDGTYGEVKANQLESVYEGLNKKGLYTFIQFDLPGFGGSRPPNRDYSPGFFERDAKCAIAFMEALKIDKYSVMGWCYGGNVALHVASLAPNRVLKVVEWAARTRVNETDVNINKKFCNNAAWRPDVLKTLTERCGVDYFSQIWKDLTNGYEYIYENNNGFCITPDQLQRIEIPILIIHGTADGYVGQYHANHVHNNSKYSKFVKILNAHHEMHKTHNEKFCFIVNDFLSTEFMDENKTILEI